MAFFRSGLLIPDLKENINTMRKEMEGIKNNKMGQLELKI